MYRVGVFGNNKLAISVLKQIKTIKNMELVVVIPEGKDLIHSKKQIANKEGYWENSFLDYVKHYTNVELYIGNINEFKENLLNLNLDILFGCRSSALVKKNILRIPKIGVTNFHYGDLPKYGGCHTIQHAILNNEKQIGVSFHFMGETFDTGPMIAKEYISIQRKTSFEIYQECSLVAEKMFYKYFQLAIDKICYPQKGNPMYFKSNSINFSKDNIIKIGNVNPDEIDRRIRAFSFPPFQVPILDINGAKIRVENYAR